MIQFGPPRTQNPLNVLAAGIAGIGYDIDERRRDKAYQEQEQARYDEETAFRNRQFEQGQSNADRAFNYGVGRDQIGDQRFEQGLQREDEAQAFDRRVQGFVPDPTVPTGGIATLGQGYIGSRDPGLVYDPESDVGLSRTLASGEATFGRQKALQDDQQDFLAEQAALRAGAGGGMPNFSNIDRRKATAIENLKGAVARYEQLSREWLNQNPAGRAVGRFGGPLATDQQDALLGGLQSARAELVNQWKEAAGLGALTGPDVGIIDTAIGNPTGIGSVLRDESYTLARFPELYSAIQRGEGNLYGSYNARPPDWTPPDLSGVSEGTDPTAGSVEDFIRQAIANGMSREEARRAWGGRN